MVSFIRVSVSKGVDIEILMMVCRGYNIGQSTEQIIKRDWRCLGF